jgi:hypothetical protein
MRYLRSWRLRRRAAGPEATPIGAASWPVPAQLPTLVRCVRFAAPHPSVGAVSGVAAAGRRTRQPHRAGRTPADGLGCRNDVHRADMRAANPRSADPRAARASRRSSASANSAPRRSRAIVSIASNGIIGPPPRGRPSLWSLRDHPAIRLPVLRHLTRNRGVIGRTVAGAVSGGVCAHRDGPRGNGDYSCGDPYRAISCRVRAGAWHSSCGSSLSSWSSLESSNSSRGRCSCQWTGPNGSGLTATRVGTRTLNEQADVFASNGVPGPADAPGG